MSLEHILLGMLSTRPASGYDLKRQFSERARMFWNAELSQIYPTLKSLEKKGQLYCELGDSARGPKRRVYHITPKGHGELTSWLRAGPHIGRERFAYIAQVGFLHELADLNETAKQVREMKAVWRRRLDVLGVIEEAALAEGEPIDYDDEDFHGFASLRLGIHQLGAKIAWCDETLEVIERRLRRSAATKNETKRGGAGRRRAGR